MSVCPDRSALVALSLLLLGLGALRAYEPPPHLAKSEGWDGLSMFPDNGAPEDYTARWSAGEAARAYRLIVTEQGMYRISHATLLAAGIALADLRGDRLRMFHRGREMHVFPTTMGPFGAGDALRFYAEGWDGTHSDENVLWLAVGPPSHPDPGRAGAPLDSAVFHAQRPQAFLLRERNLLALYLLAFDDSFDHWIMQDIQRLQTATFTLPTPGPVGNGTATFALRAADLGASSVYKPNRLMSVTRGAISLGTTTYRSNGSEWRSLDFSSGLLADGGTDFSLRPTTVGAYLRDLIVEYPRGLELIAGRLCFDGVAGANNFRCTGFGGATDPWVLDVSDSDRPVRLRTNPAAGGALTFGDLTAEGRTYFVQGTAPGEITALQPVDRPAIADPTDIRADLVIVADTARFPAAQTLATYRRNQGLAVIVVEPRDIYNAYGHGLAHPDAIKQFLGAVYHHGRGAPPRYALLIGEGTSDPRRYSGHSDPEFIPVRMGRGNFNYTGQDMWYGMVEGDDLLADIAIGRLAVGANAELPPILDKITAFEAAGIGAAWRNKALLCADKVDAAGDFKGRSEEMRTLYYAPNSVQTTTAYYDDIAGPTWTARADTAFQGGSRVIQYMGHGFATEWADVYGTNEVAELRNTVYPVVQVFACSSGSFFFPGLEGMSENLVEQPHGAVACFAASALAAERASAQIAHGLNEAMWERKLHRLGECVRAGLGALHAWNANSPELEYYCLVGDPCLIVNPAPASGDADWDGLPNAWEVTHGLEPWDAGDALLDPDGDALGNAGEYGAGTDPKDSDADRDGLPDGWEIALGADPGDGDSDNDQMDDAWEARYGLDPTTDDRAEDPDQDGLDNFGEWQAGTDPTLADSDFDGLDDGAETSTDPTRRDTDGDGLADGLEAGLGTDPNVVDSDGDGLPDGFPTPPGGDFDQDGLSNLAEANVGTDPRKPDSDFDGIKDGADAAPLAADRDGDSLLDGEELALGTDPALSDSDGDGLRDDWEHANGTDPLLADAGADPDTDGLSHLAEFVIGTDPRAQDSDGDGLTDGDEVGRGTDPLRSDSDFDGLSDGAEVATHGTDPLDIDTDGDSLSDGFEIAQQYDPLDPDTDGDDMPDNWERSNGLDPAVPDAGGDRDGDGLLNGDEYARGTRANNPDDDGDGLDDGDEVHVHGTDPDRADTDGDGAWDDVELAAGTDPTDSDTDNDGLRDGFELAHTLNPFVNDAGGDPDGDTLSNLAEQSRNTNPRAADTDGDGLRDDYEIANNLLPYRADHDNDGLDDGDEVNVHGTNPVKSDHDNDGLRDGQEVNVYGTDPTDPDTDGDGLDDRDEILTGSDPNLPDAGADPDSDGLDNLAEHEAGTRGDDDDSDNDGLTDGAEVNTHGTNPRLRDTDGDSLSDRDEIETHGTDPLRADSDGDGMPDDWELAHGISPTVVNGIVDGDGDGLPHLQEYLFGTDPFDADTDGDDLNDLVEILFGTTGTLADSDGDGMDDRYELRHGLDPNVHDADLDADRDGVVNRAEHDAGTHPKRPESVLEIRIDHIAGGMARITWPSVAGQTYRLTHSSQIVPTASTVQQGGIAATPPTNTVDVPTETVRTLRVEIE